MLQKCKFKCQKVTKNVNLDVKMLPHSVKRQKWKFKW